MKRTSPSSRLVSSAARSPDLAITGPEVARKPTPISRARIPASVVLPSPGGPMEQHVVERLAAALGGVDEHPQILARRLLADELVEALRAEAPRRRPRWCARRGDSGGIGGHGTAKVHKVHAPTRTRAGRSRMSHRMSAAPDRPMTHGVMMRIPTAVGQCFQSMCSTSVPTISTQSCLRSSQAENAGVRT